MTAQEYLNGIIAKALNELRIETLMNIHTNRTRLKDEPDNKTFQKNLKAYQELLKLIEKKQEELRTNRT